MVFQASHIRYQFCSQFYFDCLFPEAHIISAVRALSGYALSDHAGISHLVAPSMASVPSEPRLEIGCQSVHDEDTAPGGNFGAFTTFRPASAMRQLGCTWTIIGHSEERAYLSRLLLRAGANAETAAALVSEVLHKKVEAATKVGMRVLFCIGETADEVLRRSTVLGRQIEEGLASR